MSTHAWMLAGLLTAASPAAPADGPPTPKLEKDLEVTWRGDFSEAVLRPNVRAFRVYEVESRVFVWDLSAAGADVAFFTSIKLKPEVKTAPEPQAVVRLQLARVEPNGKVGFLDADALDQPAEKRQPRPAPPLVLEGLPTLETGLFLAFPAQKLQPRMTWEAAEEKRLPLKYRLERLESVHGGPCWKVVAGQQTDDWDSPHPGREAWRRGETLWISTSKGCVMRLERTIEKNDPQTGQLGFRSKLKYEQVGWTNYPLRFGDDRRDEVAAAARFAAEYERLLADPGRDGPKAFEALLQRIEQHITSHITAEAVPYRLATFAVQRKAQAAKRGHIPPTPPPAETVGPAGLSLGRPAPDFTVRNLSNSALIQLSELRGKPVVLIYYQPSSAKSAEPALRFADMLHNRHGHRAAILPLAIGNSDAALTQANDLKVAVSVLAGRDVYKVHGVESAPFFVVIDANGKVTKLALGWSDENAGAVRAELERLLK